MASRILHLAIASKIMELVKIKNINRFQFGMMLPDAYNIDVPKAESHLKIFICGGTKKTYDLSRFKTKFREELKWDELYLGYYLHLIQDLVFRKLVYEDYKWNPLIPGNVERLHNDYQIINGYVIDQYEVRNTIVSPVEFEGEKINDLYPFDVNKLINNIKQDYVEKYENDIFFFTKDMADEFVTKATDICIKEILNLREDVSGVDEYQWAWRNKCASLLQTTQNTRELGGFKTKDGSVTRWNSLIRSDVQNVPSEEDFSLLKERGITTINDMRGEKDITRKPSGFANATTGVMFNCTAGKDRTGVVAGILLAHAGVKDADIIENYVLTKEYGKERLELVHRKFPYLDMNIVTPNEMFMEKFLMLFRERYESTNNYFGELGLSEEEIEKIYNRIHE